MTIFVLIAMAIRDFAGRVLAHSLPTRARHPRSRKLTVIPAPPLVGVNLLGEWDNPGGTNCPARSTAPYVACTQVGANDWQAVLPPYLGHNQVVNLHFDATISFVQAQIYIDCGAGYVPIGISTTFSWDGTHHWNSGAMAISWFSDAGTGTQTIDLNY